MRRADRLFRIVQFLRAGRLQTARSLAEKLQVSDRTIYRDVQDLQLSGVPIEGEAGVGYTLRRDYDLPPLMFNLREITALVLGSRMVAAWGDDDLASAANDALRKIEAVLTPTLRDKIDAVRLYAPSFQNSGWAELDNPRAQADRETRQTLAKLRNAIETRHIVAAKYGDEKAQLTERRVRPMALLFWGNVWTLAAWCELRNDFRSFRADRFHSVEILEETFTPQQGQQYEDFLARVRRDLEAANPKPDKLAKPAKPAKSSESLSPDSAQS
jgi:predicted DNA-binding transcriptional regulator YafY